jgi:small-conductance mechanosensitive channel
MATTTSLPSMTSRHDFWRGQIGEWIITRACGDGEVFTIPNGQIVRSVNLPKDWARAVVDIPVPVTADLNHVNEVLNALCGTAMADPQRKDLLLDEPSPMGPATAGGAEETQAPEGSTSS